MAKELLRLAQRGEASGLVFVAKLGRHGHRAGIVGDYRNNPDEALPAASQLKEEIQRNRDEEEYEESGT